MDVLTDVLRSVRLASAVYGRMELTAPWGLQLQPHPGHASFHVVSRGGGWLALDDLPTPVALTGGDFVLLPHGGGYSLRDSPGSPTVSAREIFKGDKPAAVARHGGGGALTSLVGGCFTFEDNGKNPLVATLPPLIHVRGEEGPAGRWLEATMQFITAEASSPQPGSQLVIGSLADILFVHAVRAHLANLCGERRAEGPPGSGEERCCSRAEDQPGGWLRALADPQIGRALGLLHQSPADPWTVESLAASVGASRSALASRFTTLVGEPPLTYLTRWRMHLASQMLRRGHAGLAEISAAVGYEAEAAFSKAFKRWTGVAPGAYRKTARSAGSMIVVSEQ